MRKQQQFTIIVSLFCILIFGGNVGAQGKNEQIIAYWASSVSDATPVRAAEFVTNVQERLKEFDVDVSLVRWYQENDKPENAIVYMSFNEEFNGERVIVGTDVGIYTQANIFANTSSILESNYPFYFSIQDPNSENLVVGLILYSVSEYEEAEQILQSVQDMTMQFGSAKVDLYLGNLSLLQDNYERAIEFYKGTVWSNTGRFWGVNLAWTYFQIGRTEDSFKLLDDAIEQSTVLWETSPAYLLSVRAQLYALAFDYDSAIADMDTVIELAEENELDNTTLAELYTIRGEITFLIYEWDRVLDNFNHALELAPDYAPAYFQRGVLYYTMALREDALADFEHYLVFAPEGQFAEEAQDYLESIPIELEALGG